MEKREFKKYQHIERYGTQEVLHIELGKCYIFPKIDGTNASIWLDENKELQAGSRKRHLSLDEDNAGFYKWALTQKNLKAYLEEHPTHRLFGEWLVPHSLRTYQKDAWNRFYVFDIAIDKAEDEIRHQGDSLLKYMPYETYRPLLKKHGISFLEPLAIIENGTLDQFSKVLQENEVLIEEGKGIGEGIVLKNYDFFNRYGRQTWAKLISSDFQQKNGHKSAVKEATENNMVEELIAKKYMTDALFEKTKAKITLASNGFSKKEIPRLLHTIYYDIIKEESWDMIKSFKNPAINFKRLQHFIYEEVKSKL